MSLAISASISRSEDVSSFAWLGPCLDCHNGPHPETMSQTTLPFLTLLLVRYLVTVMRKVMNAVLWHPHSSSSNPAVGCKSFRASTCVWTVLKSVLYSPVLLFLPESAEPCLQPLPFPISSPCPPLFPVRGRKAVSALLVGFTPDPRSE